MSYTSSSGSKVNFSSLYPPNWPYNNPFHKGEVAVQKRMGSHEHVMSYAPKFVRPFLPEQHVDFYESLPFLVVAARDVSGRMWATLLWNNQEATADGTGMAPALVQAPNPKSLLLHGRPAKGDALEGAFQPGSDVGIIGIEFHTKRRNRVNGRIAAVTNNNNHPTINPLLFQVEQSFGNCPQYIVPRKLKPNLAVNQTTPVVKEDGPMSEENSNSESSFTCENSNPQAGERSVALSDAQIRTIQQAETIFLATGYRDQNDTANSQDPRYGNDASHRGGPSGFLHVLPGDRRTILIPDYSGNHHYNTIGNLIMDARMGLTIPTYDSGAMLQLSGKATVVFDTETADALYPGIDRLIQFKIDEIVDLPKGTIPLRWTTELEESRQRKLFVNQIIQESEDVKSFHLRPLDNELQTLWEFYPGQHLPIALNVDDADQALLERTYSLSGGSGWVEYRISVKRQMFGQGSSYLHDHVNVGDTITVQRPAGDFVYTESPSHRASLFLSSGIGITPVLSMLHDFVENCQAADKSGADIVPPRAIWLHQARDGMHHPFQQEVAQLKEEMTKSLASLQTHIVYSRPTTADDKEANYDSRGHVNVDLLRDLIPDATQVDVYMCGNGSFIADMEKALTHLGVPSKQIRYESF